MTKTSRSIRFDDDVWEKAQTQANRLGLSVAAYLTMLVKTARVRVDHGAEQPIASPVAAQRPVSAGVFDDLPTRNGLVSAPAGPDPFDAIFAEQKAARDAANPPYDPTLDPESRQFDKERARAVAAPWDNIA